MRYHCCAATTSRSPVIRVLLWAINVTRMGCPRGSRIYGQGCYYNADELVYNVRSHYCPAFGFCADVRREGIDWDQFRKLTEEWRTISQCLLGDFYPLTPYTLAEDAWIAWQFHRADTGEGVVQVFRRPKSSIPRPSSSCRGSIRRRPTR